MASDTTVLAFGEFELDFERLELRRNGERVEIQPMPLRVLLHLAERRDRTVPREELLEAIWEGANVTDTSVANALNQAREAVGDDGTAQRVVRTLKKHGYRFVAETSPLRASSPAQQPASARHRVALWAGGVAAVVVLASLTTWWQIRSTAAPPAEPIRSVAVLPLTNLSGDPEQEYFADGMTEALIGSFAKIGSLRVISRTSVMRYKDERKPLREIAQELDVDGIVEGSVLRVGDRIRITAQLIDARTDSHLWSGSYERDLSDVLALLSDVPRAVVEQVQVRLSPDERAALVTARSVNPQAFDAYLIGSRLVGDHPTVYWWGPAAIDQFERAVSLDPGFAEAWSALGLTRLLMGMLGFPPRPDLLERARDDARRALAIDDRLGVAHAVLASVLRYSDWDSTGARERFERALQLSPNDPHVLITYARYLLEVEARGQEAFSISARAVALAPFDPLPLAERARLLFYARHFELALAEFERVRELSPGFRATEEADCHELLGRLDESHEAWIGIQEDWWASEDATREAAQRGWAEDGWAGFNRAWLEIEKERRGAHALLVASLSTSVGEDEQALEWLERARLAHEPLTGSMPKSHPVFDPLRDDPRFDDLLRRIGLEKVTGDPGVLAETGRALAFRGRSADAAAYLEKAMVLGPDDPRMARWLYSVAVAHFAEERYETATDWAERALARSTSEYVTADANLLGAASYAHLGRADRAQVALDEALRVWPEFRVDIAPLPAYTDPGLRERYVTGLRFAGLSPQAGS